MPYELQNTSPPGLDQRALEEGKRFIKQVFSPIASAKTPQEKYDAVLDAIRHGLVIYKSRAEELAREHNIGTKDLPGAIEQGEKNLLLMYAEGIAWDNFKGASLEYYRKRGQELAKKMGYDLDELVETIIINSAPF